MPKLIRPDFIQRGLNQQGSGLDASDVEYVEQDATGTVTAASDGSLTITDDSTGHAVTFAAEPDSGTFDGVGVGDSVDVTTPSGKLTFTVKAIE